MCIVVKSAALVAHRFSGKCVLGKMKNEKRNSVARCHFNLFSAKICADDASIVPAVLSTQQRIAERVAYSMSKQRSRSSRRGKNANDENITRRREIGS